MRCLLMLCLLTGAALSAQPGNSARSNALSAKEAADGWLLLFDGETTSTHKSGTWS